MNKSTTNTNIELRNRGIIYLSGPVDTANIKTISEDLIYMNELKDPEFKAVQLMLNSTGGNLRDSFSLTDLIEYSKLPVYITGLGICASAGLLILCSGAKGHRVITQNTTLLSHQYSWSSCGKHHELIADRKEADILQEKMINHYLKHTNLNKKEVNKFLLPESDVWLTPAEAKKYGLIDKVIK